MQHRLLNYLLSSQTAFGVTIAGEFSNAINDCGLFVNGVGGGHSYGGDCTLWTDSSLWNQTIVDGLHDFMLASMDALQVRLGSVSMFTTSDFRSELFLLDMEDR